jgi:hypothetical protein
VRKLCLLKSLFLDKNLNQIDSLIHILVIFILCNAFSIGWVAVAVAVAAASVVLVVQKGAMPPGWVAVAVVAASIVLVVQKDCTGII